MADAVESATDRMQTILMVVPIFPQSEGFQTNDGSLVIAHQIRRLQDHIEHLTILIRRLGWTPLDFPIVINDHAVQEARTIGIDTEDDAQVVTGYIVDPECLATLLEQFPFELIDLQLFEGQAMKFVVSLTYFEGYVGQVRAEPIQVPELSPISPSTNPLSKEQLYITKVVRNEGATKSLSAEGKALARPLKLKTIEWQFSPEKREPALGLIVNRVLGRDEIVGASLDWFRGEYLSSNSFLATKDAVQRKFSEFTQAPFGTFLFFDHEWRARIWIHRRIGQDAWAVIEL